jgi:hypothetical protein
MRLCGPADGRAVPRRAHACAQRARRGDLVLRPHRVLRLDVHLSGRQPFLPAQEYDPVRALFPLRAPLADLAGVSTRARTRTTAARSSCTRATRASQRSAGGSRTTSASRSRATRTSASTTTTRPAGAASRRGRAQTRTRTRSGRPPGRSEYEACQCYSKFIAARFAREVYNLKAFLYGGP